MVTMMDYDGIPYFLTDEEWYREVDDYIDPVTGEDRGYILTDKAPQEAIDSYNEFYSDETQENGMINVN